MEVSFRDATLDQMEIDPSFEGGYPHGAVKAFRKRLQGIRSAIGERDFYAMKSWHFEKLKGKRAHQRSIRLNHQFRLILEIKESGSNKQIEIVSIEDYH